jgi:hypothetical protein
MKTLMGIAALSALLGCAEQAPVTMPQLMTAEGKTCARSCQTNYTQCEQACGEMVGHSTIARQRYRCLTNCEQILQDCYSTCK